VLGEEYSGPIHFVRFWLDTIRKWSREKNRDVLVMLSACRNVQEEILSIPEHAELVDVIDVKYWWHTASGGLYDPPGGQNQAPRQQLRAWSGPKSRTTESTCLSVRDLKARFPEKAVVCSLPTESPWQLLSAGCSLPELPTGTDEKMLRELVKLSPETSKPEWSLRSSKASNSHPHDVDKQVMIVASQAVKLNKVTALQANVVNVQTGQLEQLNTAEPRSYSEKKPCVIWVGDTN
jgi:hypothetical protein